MQKLTSCHCNRKPVLVGQLLYRPAQYGYERIGFYYAKCPYCMHHHYFF